MPPPLAAFVVEELTNVAVQTALHCFGCRVICRLLEHCPHEQTQPLVDELLREGKALCMDTFGNHVVRTILEHGTPRQRGAVAQILLADPLGYASQRNASCVVEKALSCCGEEDSAALAQALVRDAGAVAELACGRYGSYVVLAVLGHPSVAANEARVLLGLVSPKLQESKFGRRVLQGIEDGGMHDMIGPRGMQTSEEGMLPHAR